MGYADKILRRADDEARRHISNNVDEVGYVETGRDYVTDGVARVAVVRIC